MSQTCSHCNASVEENQRFCGSCGKPLSEAKQQKPPARSCLGCLGTLLLVVLVIGVVASLGSQVEQAGVGETAVEREQKTPTPEPAEPTPAPTNVVQTTARTTVRANFRSGPSTEFKPYQLIEPGENVSLLLVHQTDEETWYRAKYGELTGWLSSTVLDVGASAAKTLPSLNTVVDAAASGGREVQDYLITAALSNQLITEAMANNGTLFSNPNLTSERWLSAVLSQQQAIHAAHQMMQDYTSVPTSMLPLHEQFVDATAECDAMATGIEQGIARLDKGALNASVASAERCATKLTALAAQMEQSKTR